MRLTTLILFDIDGTILHAHGAGRYAFTQGLKAVFDIDEPMDTFRFAGATDWAILDEVAARHRIAIHHESRSRFFAVMAEELENAMRDGNPATCPGGEEVIRLLASFDDVQLGLVTGNTEACARIKLRRFGLDTYFAFGGFGDEHPDRDEMARLALTRARAALADGANYADIVLIGDTPNDIKAARAINARAFAVHSPLHPPHELAAAGADVVAESAAAALGRCPRFAARIADGLQRLPTRS